MASGFPIPSIPLVHLIYHKLLFLQMTVFPRRTCTLVTTQLTLEEVDVEEEENIKDEEETLATTLLPTLQTRSLCLGRPGMLWQ